MLKKDILKGMVEDQYKIDKSCWEKAHVTNNTMTRDRVALLVELGELANEVNSWKYWKKGKFTDKNKASEELADCIAFTLTLLKIKNRFNVDKLDYKLGDISYKIGECENQYKFKEKAFLNGYEVATLLDGIFYLVVNENYHTVLVKLFEVGFMLGLNFDKIVSAYYRKRNINIHQRGLLNE